MFRLIQFGRRSLVTVALTGVLSMSAALQPVFATGEIGDHVNDLQAHLDEYAESVRTFLAKTDELVGTYARDGAAAVDPARLIDFWEAAKIHAAIEVNHAPIYAAIWQGIDGVQRAIENERPIEQVRERQAALEQALWQALGAVKMAAKVQAEGGGAAAGDPGPADPVATIDEIKQRLDQVVARYEQQEIDAATSLVHETYANRFEGVEGALIEQDAELVLDLEKDFNVTLPQQIAGGASPETVRQTVADMQQKLDRAKTLLAEAQKNRKDVF